MPISRKPNHRGLWLIYPLMLVLFWTPLPFGSKPEWAVVLLCWLVIVLAIVGLANIMFGQWQPAFSLYRAWPFHVAFLVILGWVWLQSIPLPVVWVEWLSPESYQHYFRAYTATGELLPDSIPLSLDAYATRISGWLTLAYYLLFCLVLALVSSETQLKRLAWTLVAAGTFQAAFGAFSTLSGVESLLFADKETYLNVATGTFVNRNSFAGFLEMTLAVGIGLLLAQMRDQPAKNWKDRIGNILKTLLSNKVILRSALAAMVIGLVLSRSRMGNSAFFSSLIIAGILYIICRRKLSRGILFLFASLIIVDMAILSQWFGIDQVINRIEQTSMEKESRPNVAKLTLDIIADYPTTGTGAGTYYTALPAYHDGSWRRFYDLAHNDFLQFAAEFGLPAYCVLALMVLMALWHGLQAMRLRRNPLMIGMGFSSLMGITAILIHSTVDFNLQIPANGAYFVVLMAVAVIARYLPTTRVKPYKKD